MSIWCTCAVRVLKFLCNCHLLLGSQTVAPALPVAVGPVTNNKASWGPCTLKCPKASTSHCSWKWQGSWFEGGTVQMKSSLAMEIASLPCWVLQLLWAVSSCSGWRCCCCYLLGVCWMFCSALVCAHAVAGLLWLKGLSHHLRLCPTVCCWLWGVLYVPVISVVMHCPSAVLSPPL